MYFVQAVTGDVVKQELYISCVFLKVWFSILKSVLAAVLKQEDDQKSNPVISY